MPDEYDPTPDAPEGYYDQPDAWQLADEEAVGWALRDLSRARNEHDRISGEAREAIDRVRAWADDRLSGVTRRIAAAENRLAAFALAARDDGRKSVKTVYGTVQTTARQPRVDIDDDAFKAGQDVRWIDRTLAELKELYPLWKFEYRPHVAAIREHVLSTGEVLEGVTVSPQDPSVRIVADDPAPQIPNPAPAGVVPVNADAEVSGG